MSSAKIKIIFGLFLILAVSPNGRACKLNEKMIPVKVKIHNMVENPRKLTPFRQMKLTPSRHFKLTP